MIYIPILSYGGRVQILFFWFLYFRTLLLKLLLDGWRFIHQHYGSHV
jgi:hypothetical protein